MKREFECKTIGDLLSNMVIFLSKNNLPLDTELGWIDWSPCPDMMISYDEDMAEINIS